MQRVQGLQHCIMFSPYGEAAEGRERRGPGSAGRFRESAERDGRSGQRQRRGARRKGRGGREEERSRASLRCKEEACRGRESGAGVPDMFSFSSSKQGQRRNSAAYLTDLLVAGLFDE